VRLRVESAQEVAKKIEREAREDRARVPARENAHVTEKKIEKSLNKAIKDVEAVEIT
jgi:hypothetical protein